jgi:hypothetical protein
VFAQKEKFALRENLFMAVALFSEGSPPSLSYETRILRYGCAYSGCGFHRRVWLPSHSGYLIPATAWKAPNELLVSRDYEGLKSKPEWGLNVSQKNMAALEQYRFEEVISHLCQ